jgi:isoquinoline 1-oxidoreductase subunit alpha
MAVFNLNVNGKKQTLDVDPKTPVLWVLRDHLGLVGTKYGCGVAQCGACTIHLDGVAVRSCSLPVSVVENKVITPCRKRGSNTMCRSAAIVRRGRS